MKFPKNKIFPALLTLIFAFVIFTSCMTANGGGDGKLKIVATLFPQYDFARQIVGDKASVTLLLPPGMESHSFDPKPGDMLEIYNADLFVYTGANMEPWAETLIKGAANKNLVVVDCSKNIELLIEEDEADEGHEEDGHGHGDDPHIWLDPALAIKMVDNILDALCEKDPGNAEFYTNNAEDYKARLQKLDGDISDAVNNAERNVIVFGGRFSYIYFLRRFKLDYVTAYDSCAAAVEPSVAKIAEIIDFIRQNDIKYIYHEELSDPKIAKSIADETNIECLQFSTAHNVTKSEFDGGITFLDIMYANLENLKKGLN